MSEIENKVENKKLLNCIVEIIGHSSKAVTLTDSFISALEDSEIEDNLVLHEAYCDRDFYLADIGHYAEVLRLYINGKTMTNTAYDKDGNAVGDK